MKTSERLDRLPPYLFAELERKIQEKKAQGVDVISLGIGDPDTPSPEPVVQLVEGAPPLGGEGVELLAPGGDALLDDPGELVAEPREPCTLLLALRLEPFGVGHHPRLRLGDQLPLPLGEPGELVRDRALGALEVVAELLQAPLDLPLCLGERLAQHRARFALALFRAVPVLFRDPPLLFRQQGRRIGPCAHERAVELRRPLLGLAGDERREPSRRPRELLLDATATGEQILELQRRELGGEGQRDADRGHDELDPWIEPDAHPGADRTHGQQRRERRERTLRRARKSSSCERSGGDHDGGREPDPGGVDGVHELRLRGR